MSVRNDGGPAFPQHDLSEYGLGPAMIDDRFATEGMSLRDWFAGQCMRDTFAALAAAGWSNVNDLQMKRCAEHAYRSADALLAARDQSP